MFYCFNQLFQILQVDEVVSVSNPFIWTHMHKSVCVCVTVRIQSSASEQVLLRKVVSNAFIYLEN